jgi:DNA-binding NarL/FixJ family response regulator
MEIPKAEVPLMAQSTVKVLILEEDSLSAYNSKLILENRGYTVIGVADEAISGMLMAELDPPDVALVDVDLIGDINGISVAQALREKYGTRIVFVTSEPGRVILEEDFHQVGIIGKPYTDVTLIETLREAAA